MMNVGLSGEVEMRSLFIAGTLIALGLTAGATQARAECQQGDTNCIRQQVIDNISNGRGLLFGVDLGGRQSFLNGTGGGSSLTSRTGGGFGGAALSNRFRQAGLSSGNQQVFFNNINVAIGRLTQVFGNNNTFIQNIIGQLVVVFEVNNRA